MRIYAGADEDDEVEEDRRCTDIQIQITYTDLDIYRYTDIQIDIYGYTDV